jgi:hypothetical protein
MLRHIGLVIFAFSFTAVTGCHVGCCSKRASEKKCPTDIRKTHCWCFGEDALFRYPCGPNRVFYGHKATCWREWPASGSQWRDMHCGPPIAPAIMPHEAQEMPAPPIAAPAPTEGQSPNPFREEAGQASPAAEMQAPNSTGSDAAEPNTLPAEPENGAMVESVVPPQEVPPEQPMPPAPMSDDGFQPMSMDSGESQLEFQSWPVGTVRDQAPAQPQTSTVAIRAVPPVAPAYVVEDSAPPFAATPSRPITESGSQWRLVIHDNPDGIAADSRDNASLFRPPSLGGAQTPAPQAQKPAPPKRSLEEQTGDALERFMSFDGPPSEKR